jgi:hypothetical protein
MKTMVMKLLTISLFVCLFVWHPGIQTSWILAEATLFKNKGFTMCHKRLLLATLVALVTLIISLLLINKCNQSTSAQRLNKSFKQNYTRKVFIEQTLDKGGHAVRQLWITNLWFACLTNWPWPINEFKNSIKKLAIFQRKSRNKTYV